MSYLLDLDTPGKRLRFVRKELRGMKQVTLGSLVGKPQAVISQWENDLWKPAWETQCTVAVALGVPRAWLFDGVGELAA